jgi:hypothetical protein
MRSVCPCTKCPDGFVRARGIYIQDENRISRLKDANASLANHIAHYDKIILDLRNQLVNKNVELSNVTSQKNTREHLETHRAKLPDRNSFDILVNDHRQLKVDFATQQNDLDSVTGQFIELVEEHSLCVEKARKVEIAHIDELIEATKESLADNDESHALTLSIIRDSTQLVIANELLTAKNARLTAELKSALDVYNRINNLSDPDIP